MEFASSGPPIANIPGKVEKEVEINQARREIRHSWKRSNLKVILTSVLLRADTRKPYSTQTRSTIPNDMEALRVACGEHEKGIRETAEKICRTAAAGATPARPGKRGRMEVVEDLVTIVASSVPRAARTGRTSATPQQAAGSRQQAAGTMGFVVYSNVCYFMFVFCLYELGCCCCCCCCCCYYCCRDKTRINHALSLYIPDIE